MELCTDEENANIANKSLYVKNPNGTSKLAVKNLLTRFGPITNLRYFDNHFFVDFLNYQDAVSVVKILSREKVLDLEPQFAKPRPKPNANDQIITKDLPEVEEDEKFKVTEECYNKEHSFKADERKIDAFITMNNEELKNKNKQSPSNKLQTCDKRILPIDFAMCRMCYKLSKTMCAYCHEPFCNDVCLRDYEAKLMEFGGAHSIECVNMLKNCVPASKIDKESVHDESDDEIWCDPDSEQHWRIQLCAYGHGNI